jgi:hypothetical protein
MPDWGGRCFEKERSNSFLQGLGGGRRFKRSLTLLRDFRKSLEISDYTDDERLHRCEMHR